jgi:hypothetical protein
LRTIFPTCLRLPKQFREARNSWLGFAQAGTAFALGSDRALRNEIFSLI